MKTWLHRADVKASPYLYISPFFLLFGALGAFPLLFTAWVSLHDWSLLADGSYLSPDGTLRTWPAAGPEPA